MKKLLVHVIMNVVNPGYHQVKRAIFRAPFATFTNFDLCN